MTTEAKSTASDGRSLGRYYSASQLRADTWNRLKHDALRLAERHAGRQETAQLKREVAKALDILEPIETYWAPPGKEAIRRLRALFGEADYAALSQLAARIVRSLVSGSFRRHTLDLNGGDEPGEHLDQVEAPDLMGEDKAHVRPYFEVLVADKMSERQEQAMRAGLRAMRRQEDQFVYETVFVPTLEDALIATVLNPQLQAVIIRYDLPLKSLNRLEPVRRALNRIDPAELEAAHPSDRGVLLARLLGDLRPELQVYLVTDASVEEIAGRCPANVRRVFYQQEDFLELHLNILREVNRLYHTPFFTALRDYSKQPTGVFHAMPISRGKSIIKSNWIQDMGQFYGMNCILTWANSD